MGGGRTEDGDVGLSFGEWNIRLTRVGVVDKKFHMQTHQRCLEMPRHMIRGLGRRAKIIIDTI